MTPEAVIFDIGNVLLTWAPHRHFDARVGEARRRAFFASVPVFELNDRVDLGENFHEIWTKAALDFPDWSEEISIWHQEWIHLVHPAIDHSVRVLHALKSAGVPVFALSNFGRETFETACETYPFLTGFDRSYISGQMEMKKPDPQIYTEVEKDCGIPANRLLFTDDLAANIQTATDRGWQTHLFEAPGAFAERLVSDGLLTREAAQ